MSGIIHDSERAAAKLALLLGAGSVQRNTDGIRLVVSTGQQINLLLPHAYRARFGDISQAADSERSRLGAMTLCVESLGRTQEILTASDLAFDMTDKGGIRVGPDYTCGITLDFTEESVS